MKHLQAASFSCSVNAPYKSALKWTGCVCCTARFICLVPAAARCSAALSAEAAKEQAGMEVGMTEGMHREGNVDAGSTDDW